MIELMVFLALMAGILATLALLVLRVEQLERQRAQDHEALREEIRQSVLLINTWTKGK